MGHETACSYLRVSTSQQARHDLSIPDQRNQILDFVKGKGWDFVAEFVEPGASARSDKRPVFQEMMARALNKPPEFTRIVVYSMSRLFRDEMYYELYRRKLQKNGVEIVSITQDFGTGPAGDLTRRIMALTDEINSVENARHVRRTMIENARQNFWNGSVPCLGYKSVVAEVRGQKQKKRLEIDPERAETVRLIYRLYLEGDGRSGPLGIKNTVRYLNERNYKTPTGRPFHISYVEKILKNETYVGRAWYNVEDSTTGVIRPKDEWICVSVPPIISEETFARVQEQLALRSPKVTAPRIVNSMVLLTGLVICGGCGFKMRRQPGKGGRYHYFRCSSIRRTGSCPGGTRNGINVAALDAIVLEKVADQLLTPERVQAIVSAVAAKREAGSDEATTTLRQLREQRSRTTKKLSNLINMLAEGTVELSDTYKLAVKQAEADAKRLANLIATQESLVGSQLRSISLNEANAAASQLRDQLLSGEPALKRRVVRSFITSVIVTDDKIVITGPESDLAEVVTGSIPNV